MIYRPKFMLLLAIVTITAGCGTTLTYNNITSEQRNEAWQQVPINRIAVVAVTGDRSERIGSETVFVDRLKQLGIDAIVSHEFAPILDSIDTGQEAISLLAERNADAVLTVAVANAAQGYDRGTYWEARGWAYILGSDNSYAWGDLADAASYWGKESIRSTLHYGMPGRWIPSGTRKQIPTNGTKDQPASQVWQIPWPQH